MKKKAIFLLVLGVFLIFGYNYIYKDHRVIEKETPDFVTTSNSIFLEFLQNQKASETKYLDKTIEIKGVITELNNNDLTLDNKIFCKFTDIVTTINLNDHVKLKGRCIGYDDLLEQVKLDQCNLIDEQILLFTLFY